MVAWTKPICILKFAFQIEDFLTNSLPVRYLIYICKIASLVMLPHTYGLSFPWQSSNYKNWWLTPFRSLHVYQAFTANNAILWLAAWGSSNLPYPKHYFAFSCFWKSFGFLGQALAHSQFGYSPKCVSRTSLNTD